MNPWSIEVTEAAEAELGVLPEDIQARFLHVMELLKAFGPHNVGMPHVRPLGDKLWEMRLKGKGGIARAIYFAAIGQRLVVVRFFVKKTRKTPRREIDLAVRRMNEFLK
jgi:phage-related protein